MGNIVNLKGVPLPGQRSDDWLLEETPLAAVDPAGTPGDAAKRNATGQIRKELELGDLERRVMEAEATAAKLKPLLEKADAEKEKRRADAEKKAAPSGRQEERP
jgi:hypothetical protein